MEIRTATTSDLQDVLRIERSSFGSNEEAELVEKLLTDPSAEPALSLLAFVDGEAVGHILFTAVKIKKHDNIRASILAPLAVVPSHQKQGLGGELIKAGLQRLADSGTELVFVLGYPEYYTRHGFEPAIPHGLIAPYPIPDQVSDAWMVQALKPGLIGHINGNIACCDILDNPKYWIE